MTVLLYILERRGFTVTLQNGSLRVNPASRLTDDLRAAIRDHRDELVAMLTAAQRAPSPSSDPRPDLGDSDVWTALLAEAHKLDADDPNGAYGALLGLRACGCQILKTSRGPRLAPSCGDEVAGWASPSEWMRDVQKYVFPHADRIKGLLATTVVRRPESATLKGAAKVAALTTTEAPTGGWCSRCGAPADLAPAGDVAAEVSEEGAWLACTCSECGDVGYIREAEVARVDPAAWAKRAAETRREYAKAAARGRTPDPEAMAEDGLPADRHWMYS